MNKNMKDNENVEKDIEIKDNELENDAQSAEENKEEKPQETAIEQEAPKQTVVEEDDEKAPTPEELRSRPTQQAVNPYLPRNEISFAPRQPQQQESMPQQPMQGDNTTEQQHRRKGPLPQRSSDRPRPRRISHGQDSHRRAACPA